MLGQVVLVRKGIITPVTLVPDVFMYGLNVSFNISLVIEFGFTKFTLELVLNMLSNDMILQGILVTKLFFAHSTFGFFTIMY